MSATVNVHDAKTQFSKLLDRAHSGEEIIVAKSGRPYARLVKLEDTPKVSRKPGGWPELAALADDAIQSAMTDADLDAWEQKLRDI